MNEAVRVQVSGDGGFGWGDGRREAVRFWIYFQCRSNLLVGWMSGVWKKRVDEYSVVYRQKS